MSLRLIEWGFPAEGSGGTWGAGHTLTKGEFAVSRSRQLPSGPGHGGLSPRVFSLLCVASTVTPHSTPGLEGGHQPPSACLHTRLPKRQLCPLPNGGAGNPCR